jgi:MFS family permease
MKQLDNHHLIATLKEVRGNPRACLITEPLWGIPFNLVTPFATLYMYALGVQDRQIGLILTVGMILQILSAALGGLVTDKFGRRKVTVVVDLFAWSLATLVWALAQNFWWFLAAAALNSLWQVTSISWQCLLVEECEQRHLVDVYTWVNIAGLMAVFFAPISTLLVGRFTLVPTVRVLYGLFFVLMITKQVLLYVWSTETPQGTKRMAETKGLSIWSQLPGYRTVLAKMMASPEMKLVVVIFVLVNITSIAINNFFALYITKDIGIPEHLVALFPIGRALAMLVFTMAASHWVNRLRYRPVLIWGFTLYLLSHLLLLLTRPGSWLLVIGYTLLEATAFALIIPRRDALGALLIDKEERARVMSLILIVMLTLSAPFGAIMGYLSSLDRRLPFLLNVVLFAGMIVLVASSRTLAIHDHQSVTRNDESK